MIIDSNKAKLFEIMHKVNPDFKKLNEGYISSEDDFNFSVRLTNSSFYNFNNFSTDYDVDIVDSDITINWSLRFWLNQSGIENMIVNVKDINGYYNVQQYDKHSDQLLGETQKNVNEIEWKFITSEGNISFNGTLYIKDLTFDVDNKTCTLRF